MDPSRVETAPSDHLCVLNSVRHLGVVSAFLTAEESLNRGCCLGPPLFSLSFYGRGFGFVSTVFIFLLLQKRHRSSLHYRKSGSLPSPFMTDRNTKCIIHPRSKSRPKIGKEIKRSFLTSFACGGNSRTPADNLVRCKPF